MRLLCLPIETSFQRRSSVLRSTLQCLNPMADVSRNDKVVMLSSKAVARTGVHRTAGLLFLVNLKNGESLKQLRCCGRRYGISSVRKFQESLAGIYRGARNARGFEMIHTSKRPYDIDEQVRSAHFVQMHFCEGHPVDIRL